MKSYRNFEKYIRQTLRECKDYSWRYQEELLMALEAGEPQEKIDEIADLEDKADKAVDFYQDVLLEMLVYENQKKINPKRK